MGKVIGRPSVFLVGSKEEAKQQVKTLARKLYGLVNKTAAGNEPCAWRWQFRLSSQSRSQTRQRFRNYQSETCPAGAAINAPSAIERLICATNLSLPLFLSGLSRHTKSVQSCEREKNGDVHKTNRKYDGRAGAHSTTIIADQDTDQADGETTRIGRHDIALRPCTAFSAGACSSFSLKPEINEILGSGNRDSQPITVRGRGIWDAEASDYCRSSSRSRAALATSLARRDQHVRAQIPCRPGGGILSTAGCRADRQGSL